MKSPIYNNQSSGWSKTLYYIFYISFYFAKVSKSQIQWSANYSLVNKVVFIVQSHATWKLNCNQIYIYICYNHWSVYLPISNINIILWNTSTIQSCFKLHYHCTIYPHLHDKRWLFTQYNVTKFRLQYRIENNI